MVDRLLGATFDRHQQHIAAIWNYFDVPELACDTNFHPYNLQDYHFSGFDKTRDSRFSVIVREMSERASRINQTQ